MTPPEQTREQRIEAAVTRLMASGARQTREQITAALRALVDAAVAEVQALSEKRRRLLAERYERDIRDAFEFLDDEENHPEAREVVRAALVKLAEKIVSMDRARAAGQRGSEGDARG